MKRKFKRHKNLPLTQSKTSKRSFKPRASKSDQPSDDDDDDKEEEKDESEDEDAKPKLSVADKAGLM